MLKKPFLVVALVVLALIVGGSLALSRYWGEAQSSVAELHISNLSCGSCVKNIRQALDGLPGIASVDVSVTTGRGKVAFDPQKLDGARIAESVTAAGYPATVDFVVSAAEFRDLQEEQARLSERFVARVGERLISRQAFEAEMARRLAPGTAPSAAVLSSVWQEWLQREILLAAAEKNEVVVQDAEVSAKIDQMRKAMPQFDAMITARYGDAAGYFAKLKTDMTISRLLEERVFAGESDPFKRQNLFNNWYREASAATAVTVFDAALKNTLEKKGGCGGSCC